MVGRPAAACCLLLAGVGFLPAQPQPCRPFCSSTGPVALWPARASRPPSLPARLLSLIPFSAPLPPFAACRAAVLAVYAAESLLLAFALWLTQMGLSPVTAHLAAAGAGAICCGIFALIGFRSLAPEHLRPKATLQQLKRDVETVKGFAK